MEHEANGGSIPHLLQDHVLDASLIKTIMVPLREIAACVATLEGGLGLTTQHTTTTVEPVIISHPSQSEHVEKCSVRE
jgi:hypothetical protein